MTMFYFFTQPNATFAQLQQFLEITTLVPMQQVLPYINDSIFHPYLPQPCVATIDVTGDLT